MISREQYDSMFSGFPISYDQYVADVNNAKARLQAQKEAEYQDWYKKQVVSRQLSRSYGGGGGDATQWETTMGVKGAFLNDAQQAVGHWLSRERDRMTSGENPGGEFEDVYIPGLQQKYGALLDPSYIERLMYSIRRPFEKQVRRAINPSRNSLQ